MLKVLIVGVGGFLGAIGRYGLSMLFQSAFPGFPLGTFTANALGCFLISLLVFSIPDGTDIFPYWRELLITGFLGSLTTMSTFMLEGYRLMALRELGMAALYGIITLISCLVAVYGGHWVATSISS
jgi:CrcB protein